MSRPRRVNTTFREKKDDVAWENFDAADAAQVVTSTSRLSYEYHFSGAVERERDVLAQAREDPVRLREGLIRSPRPVLGAVQRQERRPTARGAAGGEGPPRLSYDRAPSASLDQLNEADIQAMLPRIQAFEIVIQTVEALAKFSQERPEADRAAVIRALAESPRDEDRALAAEMAAHYRQ